MKRMTLWSWLAVASFALGCADDSPNGPSALGPGFAMPSFVTIGTTPALTTQTVNNGPGDQTDPHISGLRVSYTSDASGAVRIHYHDLAGPTDALVPNSGESDFLSDISGSKIVFTRVGSASAIYLYDVAAPGGAPFEIAPSASANRRSPAIGGNTVAWQDFEFNASMLRPEIVVHDLTTGVTTRLTTDALMDRMVAVSPNGDVVVWVKCQTTGTGCDIWRALKAAGVWTSIAITGSEGEEATPDADGQIVVYTSTRSGDADVFWRPVAGGPEQQLSLVGAQTNPNVSGGVISFDSRETSGQSDIYAFDVATGSLWRLTNSVANETLSDISVDASGLVRVVFQSDATGDFNVHAVSFQRTAADPVAQILALIDKTLDYLDLPPLEAALKDRLASAVTALLAGNPSLACSKLNLYILAVQLQAGKAFTAEEAADLVRDAQRIKAVIGCA